MQQLGAVLAASVLLILICPSAAKCQSACQPLLDAKRLIVTVSGSASGSGSDGSSFEESANLTLTYGQPTVVNPTYAQDSTFDVTGTVSLNEVGSINVEGGGTDQHFVGFSSSATPGPVASGLVLVDVAGACMLYLGPEFDYSVLAWHIEDDSLTGYVPTKFITQQGTYYDPSIWLKEVVDTVGVSLDPASFKTLSFSGTIPISGTIGSFGSTNAITFGYSGNVVWTLTADTSPCPMAKVSVHTGGQESTDANPTVMFAEFSPTEADGTPMTLGAAAEACGYDVLDWQQTITSWPPPASPTECYLNQNSCLESYLSPSTVISIPPMNAFYDPPPGGYTYDPDDEANPYFYAISSLPTDCAEGHFTNPCSIPITAQNGPGQTMNFVDSPGYGELPTGGYMGYTTSLVGIKGDNATPLYTWKWISTYKPSCIVGMGDCFNGPGGAEITQSKSASLVNGLGTGGVTITSINGVSQIPPTTTCTVSPNNLWPPNGKSLPVTISGNIAAGTSTLVSTAYSVVDSYGQVQPGSTFNLAAGGNYSFSIPLVASRNGNDMNGRTYTIYVRGQDAIGNVGVCSAVVTVPHDQGNN